jgi:CheY-like chemotaxis protein
VLNLSKLESGKVVLNPENIDLIYLVKDTISMMEGDIKNKKLSVSFNFSEGNFKVFTDAKQILFNLLSNAIKFTSSEGNISIGMKMFHSDNDDKLVEFKIKDNGIGMTAEECAKIFDRFSQANKRTYSEYGGSGLGLLISKNFIKLLGGTIDVQSEKGMGTTFSFTIQAKSAIFSSTAASTKKQPINFINKGRFAILIVEDNLINQKVLSRILEHSGLAYFLANDGLEAVELIRRSFLPEYIGLPITVILMDIEMPQMNGLDATKAIRQLEKDRNDRILIVGLSGNARDEHIVKAKEAGMDKYLVKPYEKDRLLRIISRAGHKSMLPSSSSAQFFSPSTTPVQASLPKEPVSYSLGV